MYYIIFGYADGPKRTDRTYTDFYMNIHGFADTQRY
jgi:hypothetical protein